MFKLAPAQAEARMNQEANMANKKDALSMTVKLTRLGESRKMKAQFYGNDVVGGHYDWKSSKPIGEDQDSVAAFIRGATERYIENVQSQVTIPK